jgi:rhamnogalacturonan endolyase
VITVATSTLTHYYISRQGENIIYMATHITAQPSIGELRYIFRGNANVLTNVPANIREAGHTHLTESQDVMGFANGQTVSKYYSTDRAIDLGVRGITGSGVGVFVWYGNRETGSGGPFFRDIQFRSRNVTEIYNYMNSGHNCSEAFRMGLHGPYAYIFTNGSTPAAPNLTTVNNFMNGLGLRGWVNDAGRGQVRVNGLASTKSNVPYVIGFHNNTAQYWMRMNGLG